MTLGGRKEPQLGFCRAPAANAAGQQRSRQSSEGELNVRLFTYAETSLPLGPVPLARAPSHPLPVSHDAHNTPCTGDLNELLKPSEGHQSGSERIQRRGGLTFSCQPRTTLPDVSPRFSIALYRYFISVTCNRKHQHRRSRERKPSERLTCSCEVKSETSAGMSVDLVELRTERMDCNAMA